MSFAKFSSQQWESQWGCAEQKSRNKGICPPYQSFRKIQPVQKRFSFVFFILSWCDSEGERLDTWDGLMSLALQTLAVPDVADDAECGRGGGPPAPLPHFPGTALSWTVQYLLFQSYSEPPLTPSAQRGRHASVLGRSSCRSCCRFRFSWRCRFKFRWNHW